MQISLLDLRREYEYMKEDTDRAIAHCLESQRWILGPEVKELEEKIAEYVGTKYAVGVASGTDALLISLRALAIKTKGKEFFNKKDLIITTPFTFTSTGEVILRAGATPVFIDIDPLTFNFSMEKIKSCLASGSLVPSNKVVGIIPVHLFGYPCNMNEVIEIAKENNLFVVEDCAQSFGARWKGKKTGSFGNTGAFSFFPSKNLGGFGDGGMIVTDEEQLAKIAGMLRKHGGRDKYNVDYIGYNSRLDTVQASILLAKLKYVDEFNEKRRKIAERYNREFKEIERIVVPDYKNSESYHVFHQYTIRVLNGQRADLQKFLKEKGIATAIYYPVSLHRMKIFERRSRNFEKLKESEKATEEVLSFPIEPLMKEDEIEYIIQSVKEFFKN